MFQLRKVYIVLSANPFVNFHVLTAVFFWFPPESPASTRCCIKLSHIVTGPWFPKPCVVRRLFLRPDSFNTRYQVKSINHLQLSARRMALKKGVPLKALKFNQHLSCRHHNQSFKPNLAFHIFFVNPPIQGEKYYYTCMCKSCFRCQCNAWLIAHIYYLSFNLKFIHYLDKNYVIFFFFQVIISLNVPWGE